MKVTITPEQQDDCVITEVELELFKRIAIMQVSKALLRECVIPATVELSEHWAWREGGPILRIVQPVLGEKLAERSIRTPTDWWEAVKEHFAPGWFKRKWPVRYTVKTLTARAVYPKLSLPEEQHHIAFLLSEMEDDS